MGGGEEGDSSFLLLRGGGGGVVRKPNKESAAEMFHFFVHQVNSLLTYYNVTLKSRHSARCEVFSQDWMNQSFIWSLKTSLLR